MREIFFLQHGIREKLCQCGKHTIFTIRKLKFPKKFIMRKNVFKQPIAELYNQLSVQPISELYNRF